MHKAFIAALVAGALAVGTLPALAAHPAQGAEAIAQAALDQIEGAQATCNATLEAAVKAAPTAPENKAEALLEQAQSDMAAVAQAGMTTIENALDLFEDEDGQMAADTLLAAVTAGKAQALDAAGTTLKGCADRAQQLAADLKKLPAAAEADEDMEDGHHAAKGEQEREREREREHEMKPGEKSQEHDSKIETERESND